MELHALQTVILALILGTVSTILARWLRLPAILFYLICGVAAGPLGFQIMDADSLGTGLLTLVEIGVAIILFEGGLSLSSYSFRTEPSGIRRMLAVSIPLTGAGAGFLVHQLLGLPWRFAVFFGALIVVTGPTVIGSILKSVYLNRKTEILLKWESLWGDVLGVLLAALALEIIDLAAVELPKHWGELGVTFGLRVLDGVAVGGVAGFLLARVVLPRVCRLRDPVLPGMIVVSGALGTFFLANTILESSGPLAVAIAGFSMSHLEGEALHEVRHFKEQLSGLFISTLFVLLSASVDPMPYLELWPEMALAALIMGAVVRPAAVLLALVGTRVAWNERLFVAIIGPRGIVAVATAAYAALMVEGNAREMGLVLNLTLVVIFFSGAVATLICRPLARMLGVLVQPTGSGILMVGVNSFNSALANFAARYVPVAFLDTSRNTCIMAESLGHETVCADYLTGDVYEDAREDGFGRLVAATRNDALNEIIAQKASAVFDPEQVFRIPARPSDNALMMDALHTHVLFPEGFSSVDVAGRLERGTAELVVVSGSHFSEEAGIPLLAATPDDNGVRLLPGGAEVEPGETVLCLKGLEDGRGEPEP
jgi:NhaP-type Na+/H+ or K+/H+ antiporter